MFRFPVHNRARLVKVAPVLAAALVLAGSATSTASPRQLLWGAFAGQAPPTSESFLPGGAYGNLDAQVGKGMSLVEWGELWRLDGRMQRFPRAAVDAVRAHGSIPVLNWGSQVVGGRKGRQPRFRLPVIARGRNDG